MKNMLVENDEEIGGSDADLVDDCRDLVVSDLWLGVGSGGGR